MKKICTLILLSTLSIGLSAATTSEISNSIDKDYNAHLAALWDHFHRNPELSLMEHNTAKRLAKEIRAAGFTVTEGIGGTGIVAILKNGPGPMVMLRADMDGLPVKELSGLKNASQIVMTDWDGNEVGVMHACGHDVHITSLVGTARYMANIKDQWSGTLMLIGQPAEEKGPGASAMMADGIWQKFGQPDYALAFHVDADSVAGKITIDEGSPYAGSDSVDIIVHGVGAHGAYPHQGKDPIVIGAQIVTNLQTIISRELAPRDAGVITVGSFHSGTKHNIISERAHLQLTVRSLNPQVREQLLSAIKRVAIGTAKTAGLSDDKMPEVIVSPEAYPPTFNDKNLAQRLKGVIVKKMGEDALIPPAESGMGAEDFGFFTTEPYIPSVYFSVGGTPSEDFAREKAGGAPVPSHHSPQFKISPEPSIKSGVEASVHALLELMPKK
ncbi:MULTISPECIES: amidohydrolase [unclassified Arsukibacterium]|uniref:amidohydrolase n=1 Tax=unclassified Arsukibacterium TaxID=2635278 RepID=UPI000C64D623|nr:MULTISPECIES: amidohydrolase [unclassified Arsukibacterium]MAA93078.1 peptidase M20 [Rheinheimera sp.]MBM35507.1 peptidase M20 [Rheinheimera sp.]HAW93580.1 amidohydrolase [Candidatus Azambacteria bacterium]|tara:strand:+ start:75578 stop:76900 length:1323 start_codon:yes stop_codon:yes gene_type:complete